MSLLIISAGDTLEFGIVGDRCSVFEMGNKRGVRTVVFGDFQNWPSKVKYIILYTNIRIYIYNYLLYNC